MQSQCPYSTVLPPSEDLFVLCLWRLAPWWRCSLQWRSHSPMISLYSRGLVSVVLLLLQDPQGLREGHSASSQGLPSPWFTSMKVDPLTVVNRAVPAGHTKVMRKSQCQPSKVCLHQALMNSSPSPAWSHGRRQHSLGTNPSTESRAGFSRQHTTGQHQPSTCMVADLNAFLHTVFAVNCRNPHL